MWLFVKQSANVRAVFPGFHQCRFPMFSRGYANAEAIGSVLPAPMRAAVVAAMQTQRETQNPFLDDGVSVWVQYRGLWGVPPTFHVNVCLFHPMCKLQKRAKPLGMLVILVSSMFLHGFFHTHYWL